MSPEEIQRAVRRCDRRRRWPWVVLWAILCVLFIVPGLNECINWSKQRSLNRYRHTQALSTAGTIINAIERYVQDHDNLPRPAGGIAGEDWNTQSSPEAGVIAILKGDDKARESGAKDYLGDIKEAKALVHGPVGGLWRTANGVALYDPWGRCYHIRLDGDGNLRVADPGHPGGELRKQAIVWSAGPDGDPDTWDDNVRSWER